MPHHHKNHRPPLHHPPEWIEAEEKFRPVKEIGERLAKIGNLLLERGDIRLGGSEVRPSDPCRFLLRYERMPRGELSLKLELIWDDSQRGGASPPADSDLPIE